MSALTEDQVLRTLFAACMSTRRQVTKTSGRGLGLNVILTDIEGMGGSVAVQSSLGSGTTFQLLVPVTLAMTSIVLLTRVHPTKAPRPLGASRHHKTVLVVDDSPVVRDLLAEALRAHGVRVIEAGDGQDALRKLEAGPEIELVVTDVDMPKLDGIELLRRLRIPGVPRRTPVDIISMRDSSEDQRVALAAGADAYLAKTDLSHAGLWTLLVRFLG